MAIDWGFAGQIGGVGFGAVFAILIILAVVIWLVGLGLSKTGKSEPGDKEKEN